MTRQHDTTGDNIGDNARDNVATAVSFDAAAIALGVSLRTIQRRVAAGELASMEHNGARLVLLPVTVVATRDKTAPPRRDTDATARQRDTTNDTTETAMLRDELAREREQIMFLRAIVEQHQRSEAELRAALREALRASTRALPEPDKPGAVSATAEAAREEMPEQTPHAAPVTNAGALTPSQSANGQSVAPVVQAPQNARKHQEQKKPRPLWKAWLGVR